MGTAHLRLVTTCGGGMSPGTGNKAAEHKFKAGALEDSPQDYANGASERLRADCIGPMSEARPFPACRGGKGAPRSPLEREAQSKLDPAGTREAVRRNELGVDHAEGAGVGDVEGRVEKIGVVEDVEAVE